MVLGYLGIIITQENIDQAGSILLKEAGPGARVLLFGSHARGEAEERSDLDFLVIQPLVENKHTEMVRLRRALSGIESAIDVLVASQSHIDEWGHVHGTVVNAALKDGIEISGK